LAVSSDRRYKISSKMARSPLLCPEGERGGENRSADFARANKQAGKMLLNIVGLRQRAISGVMSALAVMSVVPIAFAGDCKSSKDALGTARVVALDPAGLPQVGTLQYPQTVPLKNHEVVLTFDDGPAPSSTPEVLDALAAQCVKANFFVVGEHARAAPELVRREFDEGHTVGTHSQTHADLAKLSLADAQNEVQDGIESANFALKPSATAAPFFRAPYLSTTPSIDNYLAKAGLMLWSIDVDPEDWRPLTPDEVVSRIMTRLELKGSGIILMHDVQSHTAAAISQLLHELKTRDYNVVHVIYGSAKEAAALPQ
jgi:peptidoglycan-N-acetylglucosamine deacetylase